MTSTSKEYTEVPGDKLTKGMVILTLDRFGRTHFDCRLGDPFTVSGRIQPIAFNTVDGNGMRNGTVRFERCAIALVSTAAPAKPAKDTAKRRGHGKR